METAYRELINLKANLPPGSPIGPQPILDFNTILMDVYDRTDDSDILGLEINERDVIPMRPDPRREVEHYCARPRFVAKLEKALEFFESRI